MKRNLYIITRCYAFHHQENDEFVSEWGFRAELESQLFESEGRRVIFIHGYREKFPVSLNDELMAQKLKESATESHSSPGMNGVLAHTAKTIEAALQSCFSNFVFARNYNLESNPVTKQLYRDLRAALLGGTNPAVKDPLAFAEAFDAIWSHFAPNQPLRDFFHKKHHPLEGVKWTQSGKISNNQTQHFLVVWRMQSCNWFCTQLERYLLQRRDVTRSINIETVTSLTAFERINWSRPWEKVFVLAELSWSEQDYDGCEILIEILKRRGDEALKIVLFSAQDRKSVLNNVFGRLKLAVRSFPPLFISGNAEESPDFRALETMQMSPERWRYKRMELMSDKEILATIIHDLNKISLSDPECLMHIRACLDVLSNSSSMQDTEVILQKSMLENAVGQSEPKWNEVDNRRVRLLDLLKSIAYKMDENAGASNLPYKKQASVLIVEDEPHIAERIRALFEPYFIGVEVKHSGVEALREIELHTDNYAALITDLELLDNDGFENPVQGVDLVTYCKEKKLNIAVRIITGLRRNSIPHRLPGFDVEKIIFKEKGQPDSRETLFYLPGFIEKLHKEIDVLEKLRNPKGPLNGKFGAPKGKGHSPYLTRYYYVLQNDNPEEFARNIDRVKRQAQGYIAGNLPDYEHPNTTFAQTDDDTLETWGPLLWDLLILRLIVLGTDQLEGGKGKITYLDYNEEKGLFFDLRLDKGERPDPNKSRRSRLSRIFTICLGFSTRFTEMETTDVVHLLKLQDTCFPHESDWLTHFNLNDYKIVGREWPGLWERIRDELRQLAGVFEAKHPVSRTIKPLALELSARTTFSRLVVILTALAGLKDNEIAKNYFRTISKMIKGTVDSSDEILYFPRELDHLLTR